MENDHGFAEAMNKKGTNKKIKFFNLGQKNNYKNLLSQDLIIKMNEFFKEELIKFNYETIREQGVLRFLQNDILKSPC